MPEYVKAVSLPLAVAKPFPDVLFQSQQTDNLIKHNSVIPKVMINNNNIRLATIIFFCASQ